MMKVDVERFSFNNLLQDFKIMKNIVKIAMNQYSFICDYLSTPDTHKRQTHLCERANAHIFDKFYEEQGVHHFCFSSRPPTPTGREIGHVLFVMSPLQKRKKKKKEKEKKAVKRSFSCFNK